MASKRANEGFVKRVLCVKNSRVLEACSVWLGSERTKASKKGSVCGNSRSRGTLVFSKRANEGGTVLDLPGQTLNLQAHRVCLFGGSGRGGLHVESAIDSYEEVILP